MINETNIAAMLLRKYGNIMSDEERNQLYESVGDLNQLAQATYNLGAPFNAREAELLSRVAGNMDEDTNFEKDGDLWRDDILDQYAKYVHNYEYTYNNEAKKIDPNTDTKKHHIGPMAQDLEKVNPATVNQDKSGYKTVDTGRLALMNAGAIAELARKVERLST